MADHILSVDGSFLLVLHCLPRSGAEPACAAIDGTLADLTSMNIAGVGFPIAAIEDHLCAARPGTTRPTAWFGTWNGGVPEGKVLAIDLITHQIFADDATTAARWTRLTLGQPRA